MLFIIDTISSMLLIELELHMDFLFTSSPTTTESQFSELHWE